MPDAHPLAALSNRPRPPAAVPTLADRVRAATDADDVRAAWSESASPDAARIVAASTRVLDRRLVRALLAADATLAPHLARSEALAPPDRLWLATWCVHAMQRRAARWHPLRAAAVAVGELVQRDGWRWPHPVLLSLAAVVDTVTLDGPRRAIAARALLRVVPLPTDRLLALARLDGAGLDDLGGDVAPVLWEYMLFGEGGQGRLVRLARSARVHESPALAALLVARAAPHAREAVLGALTRHAPPSVVNTYLAAYIAMAPAEAEALLGDLDATQRAGIDPATVAPLLEAVDAATRMRVLLQLGTLASPADADPP
jgi:hypothetical protein